MKVSELLSQARDELYKGWTKSKLLNHQNGSVCAVGALRRATMSNIQHGSAAVFGQAREALNLKAFEMAPAVGLEVNPHLERYKEAFQVESFNDHRGTSQEDMLTLFDKAIIGAEEQGR